MKEIQLLTRETNIRQLMRQNKIKGKQLAQYLQLNPSTITRMLRDEEKLSIGELINILNFLGYSLELNIIKK